MITALKLIALVVLLNVVRYLVGGFIEGFTIMEPMHRVMPLYPDTFDNDFTGRDFAFSFLYNYLMWFWVHRRRLLRWRTSCGSSALRCRPRAPSWRSFSCSS